MVYYHQTGAFNTTWFKQRSAGPVGKGNPKEHLQQGGNKQLFPVPKNKETNLWSKSLISADRSNKATLLLTILRSLFKSSAKDLSSPISYIEFGDSRGHASVTRSLSLI